MSDVTCVTCGHKHIAGPNGVQCIAALLAERDALKEYNERLKQRLMDSCDAQGTPTKLLTGDDDA